MRRITGKAKDETLIELQSATDSQTGGNSHKDQLIDLKSERGLGGLCLVTDFNVCHEGCVVAGGEKHTRRHGITLQSSSKLLLKDASF